MKTLFLLGSLVLVAPLNVSFACSEHAASGETGTPQIESVITTKAETVAKKTDPAEKKEDGSVLFPLGAMEQVAP